MLPQDSPEFAWAAAWLESNSAAVPGRRPGENGPTEGQVWAALRNVIDPELGMDIVSLGLVYDIAITNGHVEVTHTLTTPGCPMEEVIAAGINAAVGALPDVEGVTNRVVWEPRWHPGMIQEVEW